MMMMMKNSNNNNEMNHCNDVDDDNDNNSDGDIIVYLVLVDETDVLRRTELRHKHHLMSNSEALSYRDHGAELMKQR